MRIAKSYITKNYKLKIIYIFLQVVKTTHVLSNIWINGDCGIVLENVENRFINNGVYIMPDCGLPTSQGG